MAFVFYLGAAARRIGDRCHRPGAGIRDVRILLGSRHLAVAAAAERHDGAQVSKIGSVPEAPVVGLLAVVRGEGPGAVVAEGVTAAAEGADGIEEHLRGAAGSEGLREVRAVYQVALLIIYRD